MPVAHRFWFGNLGEGDNPGDEVIVAAKPESLEIQCHGGRRVVRWIVELFLARGFTEVMSSVEPQPTPLALLQHATTERTAAILLDQHHGAFLHAVETILSDIAANAPLLKRLAELAPLGRRMMEPWRVVIAGPPNVGKSSLMNALAGYSRSIVAPVEGTTRDVVTAAVAFDGWPVELSDTAGLHDSLESLEAAGIAKAEEQFSRADLILWVMDGSAESPVQVPNNIPPDRVLTLWNKTDLAGMQDPADNGLIRVSSLTRFGIPEVITAIVGRLIPQAPEPGEAVPYSPTLADAVDRAWGSFTSGNLGAARTSLRTCLSSDA